LLIRATRNCPWNRCTFCYGGSYDRQKFQLRAVEEVKKDIDTVKELADSIHEASIASGYGGELDVPVLRHLLNNHPNLTGSPTFVTVFNWLASGGKTVFVQDADSLIMKSPELIEIVTYLKDSFPSIERGTSYARAKTASKKSVESLKTLKQAGLTRLHVGLETGDDDLLKKVKKGVTADEQIRAGRKIVSAGMELSLYIMPGLGGLDLSIEHARNTAGVLNEINPKYIRSRPFVPRLGTPMFGDYQSGTFRLLSPHSILREIGMLITDLTVTSRFCFDHMMNPSYRSKAAMIPLFDQTHEGYQLPDQKDEILRDIEKGLQIDESRFLHAENLINATL